MEVAPCAGAWIEIDLDFRRVVAILSPPARGRGLKCPRLYRSGGLLCRPLRGGVD